MRTLTVSLIVLLLSLCTAIAQESPAAQSYNDAGAYEIYSLLLPHEEFYGFAKDALTIQENTVPEDISGACLRQTDANRFKGAIAGYNRIYKGKWLLQRQFQIVKPYRTVGAKVISALPDHPQSAVSYVSVSPVGFNRERLPISRIDSYGPFPCALLGYLHAAARQRTYRKAAGGNSANQ